MGDPELVARAQRAAERLERSWDQWRRLHGLAAEKAQPVSSYVGYSLAEPWGRPRVVFGVGAEEAEQLSALLEQDVSEDPRFNQGLLWETESPETGEHPASGAQPPLNGTPLADGGPQASGHQTQLPIHGSAPVNGAQPAVPAQPASQPLLPGGPLPEPSLPEPSLPEPGLPESGRAGLDSEPGPNEPATEWAKSMPTFSPAPPADSIEVPRQSVPQSIGADLAGWTSGELPGQASAGLAAWPSPSRQPGHSASGHGTSGHSASSHGASGHGAGGAAGRGAGGVLPSPGPGVPSAREAAPHLPEASTGTPDPTAWLRLA